MKPLFLLVFLLLAPIAAFCQNAKIDSLKRVIETTKFDTVRGRSLCRLCDELRKLSKHDEALATGERGLEISRKKGDQKGEGNCLNNLGHLFHAQGYGSLALKYYEQSLAVREATDDRIGISGSLINAGSIYMILGDYPRSLDYLQRGVKLAEATGLKKFAANGNTNIGLIYTDLGNYPLALKYCQQGLKLFEEIGYREGAARGLINLGVIYKKQGDLHQALIHNERSLTIFEEIGDRIGIAKSLVNIGNVFVEQGDYPRALDYYQRSLTIQQEINDREDIAVTLITLGSVYMTLGRLDLAQQYSQKGLKLAQEVGDMNGKQFGAQILYRADSALGNWKSAFEAARLYHAYSDSMKNDEQSKELGRLESKAEYERQTEIDRLKNEAEKKRERERFAWMLGSAGGGLLLLVIIAFTLFQGRQKEKKANAALRALNEQISQQKAEIEAINSELQITLDEVNEKKAQIEEQHAKIEDSIRYASRIQGAILPKAEDLQAALPPHFIHFQPRDIVSGDFYWMTRQDGKTFFAAVDCTGHGVPGAFMSVLGSNLLHQIVDENGITRPAAILSALDRRIAATLRQQFGGDSKDGMDLALIVLHAADTNGTRVVEFAGAGRPLWVCSQGKITEYKSAKYSCGGSQHEGKTYPAHRIEAQAGDRLFLFSDGPVDQFGGPHGRKLGSVQLQALLVETASLSIEEQGKAFDLFFNDWMKSKKQLDDVLLAGVAV